VIAPDSAVADSAVSAPDAVPDLAIRIGPDVPLSDGARNPPPTGDARGGIFPGDAPVFGRDARSISGDAFLGVPPTLTSIGLTPPAPSVVVGVPNSTLVVTALYSDGTSKDVTSATLLASSDTTILTVSGHTMTGLKAGAATLTATYSGQTATAKVTVSASALQSISIDSVTPVAIDQSILVTATAIFADGTRQDVTAQATWSSSDATIATVALDATSGKEKIAGMKAGSTTLKASVQNVTGQAPVTVTAAPMVSILITPTQSILQRGVTQSFQATATYQDNTTADVTQQATWLSSDTAVASIATNNGGTLVRAVATGTSTITATVGTLVGTTTVTVTAPALLSIVVSPTTWTANLGGVQAFTAQATYADNSTADVTLSATWSSNATTIVGISNAAGQQGQATALAVGSASVTASLSGVVGTASVTVSSSPLVSIAVAPNPANVVLGLSVPLTATGTYQSGATQDITAQVAWTVIASSVASISNAAGTSGQITGVAVGTTTATATLNGISGTTTVNVSQPTLQSIVVSPAAPPSIAAGVGQPFTATANYGNGTAVDVTTQVTWSSSSIAVAQVSNATGSNGVAATLTAGTSTITATLSGISGTATLTVGAPALSSITLSPSTASVAVGGNQPFTATAIFQNGTTAAIPNTATWASSNTTVATVAAAGGGGPGGGGGRAAATGLAAGTTTITVTYQGKSASATLTVTAPVTVVDLTVSPTAPAAILVGATQAFTATAVMSDGNTQNVTVNAQTQWTTSNATVASISNAGGTTDAGVGFPGRPGGAAGGGLATGVAAGTVTITATYGGFSATATLTVRAPQPTGMVITPSAPPSIRVGATQQFQAVLTMDDGTTQTVTAQASWTSASALVASVSSAGGGRGGGGGAGAGGLATGIGAGTTTLTATYATFTASVPLTVTAAIPVSLTVTPPSPTLYVSQTQALVATVVYSDNTTGAATTSATWTSSDATVAVIAAGGGGFGGGPAGGGATVTGMGVGTATITVTDGALSAKVTVTVTDPPLSYVQVTPTNPNIPAQATAQFTATAVFADNSTRNVTGSASWTSSTGSVAVISTSGATAGRASGLSAGTSTITATYQGMSGASVLTVAQGISSIVVTPVVKTTVPGIPVAFTATAILSNNATFAIGGAATWISSDPTVAIVTATGSATPIKAGKVTVTATYLGVSGTATLTVSSATLASISIAPSPVTVAVNGSVQLVATGLYSDSTTIDLTNVATWTSSANAIATVSDAAGSRGLLTALGSGSATVTVYFGTSSATDAVTVSP
jgi:uncharacterized protein YjdB